MTRRLRVPAQLSRVVEEPGALVQPTRRSGKVPEPVSVAELTAAIAERPETLQMATFMLDGDTGKIVSARTADVAH